MEIGQLISLHQGISQELGKLEMRQTILILLIKFLLFLQILLQIHMEDLEEVKYIGIKMEIYT